MLYIKYMNLEQVSPKFNKELFQNDFQNALLKYILAADEINNNKGNEELTNEEKIVGLNRNELVSVSINALKLAQNKQEILEIISKTYISTFLNLDKDPDDAIWIEKDLLKEVVLNLLNK
jgi:hypothetical protein